MAENPFTAQPGVTIDEMWGPSRHKFIGMQADKLLSDRARTEVATILKPLGQSSLGEIATWADEIKGGGPKDPDTIQFLQDFPNMIHKAWHFVDLPFDATGYDRQKYGPFTNDTDVVQMIGKSVDVLRGKSNIMSKVNALRWVTHLVGDLHQPLHVACSYINDQNQLTGDPAEIIKKGLIDKSDQGGNKLILPLHNDPTLHSYWDSLIPSVTPAEAATGVAANLSPVKAPTGDPSTWAEAWALDSILASRQAYQTIEISSKKGNKFLVTWEGKNAYDQRCAPLVGSQLVLGSQRLALLINEIFKSTV